MWSKHHGKSVWERESESYSLGSDRDGERARIFDVKRGIFFVEFIRSNDVSGKFACWRTTFHFVIMFRVEYYGKFIRKKEPQIISWENSTLFHCHCGWFLSVIIVHWNLTHFLIIFILSIRLWQKFCSWIAPKPNRIILSVHWIPIKSSVVEIIVSSRAND